MSVKGDITLEEARELVSDRALWPRIRDFLWDFAPQIHPSWMEGMPWYGMLDESRRPDVSSLMASPRVKAYVLSSLGVEPCFHTFPKEDGSRLLLLDGATLESIAKWLGALVMADRLRLVTDGSIVRELKAALPGVYPEVFSYTAYFSRIDSLRDAADGKPTGVPDAKAVVGNGVRLLFSCLGDVEDALARRAVLKIPRPFGGLCEPRDRKAAAPAGLQTVNKILKLKFPEAHSLCC